MCCAAHTRTRMTGQLQYIRVYTTVGYFFWCTVPTYCPIQQYFKLYFSLHSSHSSPAIYLRCSGSTVLLPAAVTKALSRLSSNLHVFTQAVKFRMLLTKRQGDGVHRMKRPFKFSFVKNIADKI